MATLPTTELIRLHRPNAARVAPAPPGKNCAAATTSSVGTTSSVRVEVVEARELDSHEEAWQALARSALEPNPFYEPWMLRPAIEAFAGKILLRLVFLYQSGHKGLRNTEKLIGFFPCEARRRYKGMPANFLTLWQHLHCFLCTPLLDAEHGGAALRAFYEWARKDQLGTSVLGTSVLGTSVLGTSVLGTSVLGFPFVHAGGPFQQLLVDFQAETGCVTFIDESWNRASLTQSGDADAYVASILSGPKRSEMRRLRKRLADLGRLESRTLEDEADVETWIAQFLALEASGWKGQERTALGSHEIERNYFAAIARAAFARGQLMMLGLFLDGKPIALKCNFLAGDGAFAFKIAFDEKFARHSPGVLLELDNIHAVHQRPEVVCMDSCAIPGHAMIGRLWKERRTLQSLALSTGKLGGDLLLGALPLLRALRRRFSGASPCDS